VAILDPVLNPHGFKFDPGPKGKGSGGVFASGRYVRGDRSLDLHVRQSLGLVTYHIGDGMLDHETYMRFLGSYGRNRYPGFTGTISQVFERLAEDLRDFCADFLMGSGEQFTRFAHELERDPTKFKGLKAAVDG
jgi:hypothetical protein